MGSRRVRVVILAEDLQHDVFCRKFLNAIDKGGRWQFRSKVSPSGRGSGEQFVRKRFPSELETFRTDAKLLAIRLLVVIDADVLLVDQRRQQLNAPLIATGVALPSDKEALAILIPRRNIETWISYLEGKPTDETTLYPHLQREGDCKRAVEQLAVLYKSGAGLPDDCPDSLRRAVEELKRIL
jgi:hypothetical protein